MTLTLIPTRTIKAAGEKAAVARWLPIIREHKPSIFEALQVAANEAATHPARPESYVDLKELVWRVAVVHRADGDTDALIGECNRDALKRPELALRYYRTLMAGIGAVVGVAQGQGWGLNGGCMRNCRHPR